MSDEALSRRAASFGLKSRWTDAQGISRRVSLESLREILAALKTSQETCSLAFLPPMIVTDENSATPVPIENKIKNFGNVAEKTIKFILILENGETTEGDLTLSHRGGFLLPPVRVVGYHKLIIEDQETVLAVAPVPSSGPASHKISRCWGLSAQIYSLRQRGDRGMGHFGAVAEMAHLAGRAGADVLMLSPVHAMFAARPEQYSPYSPSSRLFLNIFLADPDAVFDAAIIRAAMQHAQLSQNVIDRLEAEDFVNWSASAGCRLKLFRALYDHHVTEGKLKDFSDFVRSGGEPLHQHAVFEALHARELRRGLAGGDWRVWPPPIRSPATPEVRRFADDMSREVDFHKFLQWLAARSLSKAKAAAKKENMKIGLIGDLAVGVDPAGSECWAGQADHLIGLSIGAPPDALSQDGQNWGLTTYSPGALRTTGYQTFIGMLRSGFSYGGGLRIDHVMALERLWVIPAGAHPRDGAYLTYPRDDLLRLVALEANRAAAVVIGEDLGTVRPGFRRAATQHDVLGMNVLPFQRDVNGAFLPPEHWSKTSVAMTTTHDLPTIAGWWQGNDISWREKLGLIHSDAELNKAKKTRERDRQALWEALTPEAKRVGDGSSGDYAKPSGEKADQEGRRQSNRIPEISEAGAEEIVDKVIRFVGGTDCPVAIIPVEDLLGLSEQPNIPGTIAVHPNWCRRYPNVSKSLLSRRAVLKRLAALRSERPER